MFASRLFRHAAIFIFSFCLVSLGLEILVRIFILQDLAPNLTGPAFGISNALRSDYQADAVYDEGIPYRIKTNARHLRHARDIPYEKPENTFRILCLGDSILFGYGVNNEETFSSYLEEILNQKTGGKKFEVINAAAPGWSPREYYLFLKNEGYKYSPDVVFVTRFIDDFTELPPGFVEFEGLRSERLDRTEVKISFQEMKFRFFEENGSLDKFIRFFQQTAWYDELSRRSYLFNRVRYRLGQLSRESRIDQKNNDRSLDGFVKRVVGEGDKKIVWMTPEGVLSVPAKAEPSPAQRLQYNLITGKISELAGQMKAKFVLAELPIYQEVLRIAFKPELGGFPHHDHAFQFAILRSISKFQNEHLIPLYFPKDNHWTPAGHRFAAMLAFNYLVENRILPQAETASLISVDKGSEAIEEIKEANLRIAGKLAASRKMTFTNAMIYKNQKRFEMAKRDLAVYVGNFKDDEEATNQLKLVGREEESRRMTAHAIQKLNGDSGNRLGTILRMVEDCVRKEEYSNALALLERAEEPDESFLPEIYNKEAQVYLLMGDFASAEDYFAKAIEKNPSFAGYYFNLGNLYFMGKRYELAIAQYELSLKRDSHNLAAYERIGGAYKELGNIDKAIEVYRAVLSLQPDHPRAGAVLEQLRRLR